MQNPLFVIKNFPTNKNSLEGGRGKEGRRGQGRKELQQGRGEVGSCSTLKEKREEK